MYKAPRGTVDVLPADQPYWRYVTEHAERLCQLYGYKRIDNPLFEEAALFNRSVGEGTDIVEKETYTFEDRGHDLLTLRPEGTAPVCRAYLEHGMHNLPQPVKLYYIAPSFRYERPQAGRYRQFYQFGVEAIGVQDPVLDAEVIDMAWQFYRQLGITGLTVLLNSIGDQQCRPAYLNAIVEHFANHKEALCRDCQVRLQKNPMRLLDCKEPQDQALIQAAPRTTDFLCQECAAHFSELKAHLEAMEVPYRMEHRLVRGLDYYTKTVFEIVPPDGGSQSSVGAGGRYDGLIEVLGGKPTPGIGFGLGIERTVLNLKKLGIAVPDDAQIDAYVMFLGAPAKDRATLLAQNLRTAGVKTTLSFGERSLRAQMRHANSIGARYALILGDDEVSSNTVLVRKMDDSSQESVPLTDVVTRLR